MEAMTPVLKHDNAAKPGSVCYSGTANGFTPIYNNGIEAICRITAAKTSLKMRRRNVRETV
jgi:hypothetical protein